MLRPILKTATLLALMTVPALGQLDELPDEARDAIEKAFQLPLGSDPEFPLDEYNGEEWTRAAEAFVNTLDRVAALVPLHAAEQIEIQEAQNIRAKLVAIARDRQRRPELYREIRDRYLLGKAPPDDSGFDQEDFPEIFGNLPKGPRMLRGGRRSPVVGNRHANETYRLAWEFYLLSPAPEKALPGFTQNAMDALARINNDASLPAFIYKYRVTVAPNLRPRAVEPWQEILLNKLAAFATERGLRAILECLRLSAPQQEQLRAEFERGRELAKQNYWTLSDRDKTLVGNYKGMWEGREDKVFLEDFVVRAMLRDYPPGRPEKWREVIAAFPRANLPDDQQRLLERILAVN